MHIGLLILSSISYCAIMALVYIIMFGLSSHLFKKIKIYYEIVLGFVIATISIFAIVAATSILKTNKEKNLIAYWQVLLIIISGLFISPYTMFPIAGISSIIIFLIPNYIPDMFFHSIGGSEYEILGFIIGASVVILTVLYFIKIKVPKSLSFLLILTGSELVFLITLLVNIKDSQIKQLFAYVIWYVSGYLLYAVAYLTDRIHNHAIRLRQLIEEEDEFYIASVGVKEKLKMLIAKERVRHGLLFSYFITQYDLLDKSVSPAIRDFIWQNITSQIKTRISELNPHAFFFHENYKVNGFFIPLDQVSAERMSNSYDGNQLKTRTKEDYLKQFSDIFESVTQNYLVENYRISIKFKAVCSVYGVHSSNFDQLITNNSFFIQNKESLVGKNQVYLVNPDELSELEYNGRKLKTLNSITTINNSSILFEPIYEMKKNEINGLFLNYIVDGNVVFPFNENEEQMTEIKDYGLYSVFFRFLAFKGLKETNAVAERKKDMSYFLFYDSKFVSSERFSEIEFITRIKQTGIKKENLVLVFDVNGEIENTQLLAENIVKLKSYNIKIAMLNFGANKYEFSIIPYYQPDFLIIDNSLVDGMAISRENRKIISGIVDIANKIDAKVIAQKIKSFIIYKTLKTLNLDGVFGEIIGSSTQYRDVLTDEQAILLRK